MNEKQFADQAKRLEDTTTYLIREKNERDMNTYTYEEIRTGRNPKKGFARIDTIANNGQCPPKQKQEENKMDAVVEKEMNQKYYLRDRAYEVRARLFVEAAKVFRLNEDYPPRSFGELKDRIEKGLYIWDQKKEKAADDLGANWYGPMGFVQWRDPNKPFDKEGYDAASKKIEEAFQTVEDEIKIGTPREGLEAVKAFEKVSIQ